MRSTTLGRVLKVFVVLAGVNLASVAVMEFVAPAKVFASPTQRCPTCDLTCHKEVPFRPGSAGCGGVLCTPNPAAPGGLACAGTAWTGWTPGFCANDNIIGDDCTPAKAPHLVGQFKMSCVMGPCRCNGKWVKNWLGNIKTKKVVVASCF